MSVVTAKPGFVGPWRSVQECLRQRHDEARAEMAKAIKQREARSFPTDSRLDWRKDVASLLDEAKNLAKRDDVIDCIDRARAIANGGLRPLPEFSPDPALDGVEVKLRALSKSDVMDMRAALASVPAANGDQRSMWLHEAGSARAIRPFILQALAGVRGAVLEDRTLDTEDITEAVVDDLDAAGLLPALFIVARDYQDLSPLPRRGFGMLRPSTSPSSDAASVPPADDPSSDARATPSSPTTAEPSGRPIDVRSATSSMTTMPEGVSGAALSFTVSAEGSRA